MQFIQPGNSLVQVDGKWDPAPPRHGVEHITIYRWLQILHISSKDTGIDIIAPSSLKSSEAKTLTSVVIT